MAVWAFFGAPFISFGRFLCTMAPFAVFLAIVLMMRGGGGGP